MTSGACPSEEELSRALAPGADARVAGHVAACARCRSTQEGFRDAIARARELPVALPDAARRDEVRASLLARGAAEPMGRRGRASWIAAAAAVAAAAAIVGIARERQEPAAPRSHVVVHAGAGARYELSPPPWETVRLWEGTIELDVEPLGPRDRVQVRVGDGEVEVRGTRFQVAAREDHLVGVEVSHGRVEVRRAGSPLTVLGAGQSWRAPAAAAAAPPVTPPAPALAPEAPPAPAPEPSRARASARRSSTRPEAGVERALRPTRQEELYDDAWDALRARRFDAAVRGFERVLADSPGGALADEAAFWRATSLARGGEPARAVTAFREFLAKYRASRRRGEAATILGWLLVDAHRLAEAAPLFQGAVDDPDESVRRSARDGLAATSRR
jgi:TolA-binding protein